MSYPTSIDSIPQPTATSLTNNPSAAEVSVAQTNAIVALETKLGTGSSTATSGTLLRGTGTGTTAFAQANLVTDVTGQLAVANATNVLKAIYPVGCIYTETTGVNPNTTFGFGTWTAFAGGRALVGNGTSDRAFAAGSTGGESNHTLNTSEMPAHTHNAPLGSANGGAGNTIVQSTTSATFTNVLASAGGGGAHNNLQPYIVVYFWTRTA